MTKAEADSAIVMPTGITTLIGAGMQVVGNITCKGTLRVQGTVLGNVSCNGQGDALVVDAAGAVTGEVHATNVSARGRIVGPVYSTRAIEVQEGAAITGDVAFSRLAIHAGGVVEGLLKPAQFSADASKESSQGASKEASTETANEASSVPAVPDIVEGIPSDLAAEADRGSNGQGFKAGRLGVAAVVLALAVGLGSWLMSDQEVTTAPRSDVAMASVSVTPAAAEISPAVKDNELVLKDAARLAALAPAESVEPADQDVAIPGAFATVKGANPNRPAGVFLLVSNDAAYLYKKRQNDPGDGTRINIAPGEKTSVAIAPDEIIRIARGRDVTIYFQGQKVPPKIIESESWIKFVPVR